MAVGWDADPVVTSWPGLPELDGDVSADACVVGLGGSGLAAVDALVDRGLRVVGLDAGRVGAGAAGRNGGFLLGGPALFLHEAIGRWGADAAVGLYQATLAELDAIEQRLGPDVVRRTGSIRLAGLPGDPVDDDEAAERAAELADCAALADALREHGLDVEDYDGPLGRGVFLPDDASMNPAVRVVSLADQLRLRAHLFERSPVRSVAPGRVDTARGVVSAGVVIVAVDGRLELVLPQLAGRVRTARLQMLSTAPVAPGRLPCPVYGRWGYDYAQQTADGRLFVGGGRDRFLDAEWTADTEPTAGVQAYIETVATRMAGRPVDVTHRWAASVGFTHDGRPLCVEVDDGVIAVGGYNGTGNLVGPVAARAAVALPSTACHRRALSCRPYDQKHDAARPAHARSAGRDGIAATHIAPIRKNVLVTSPEQRELAAALRAAGIGEVDASTRRRAEYSSDASNYRVVPTAVAFPHDVDEAAAAVRVARELGVPFTSRGGGTSTAGNAVGSGVVARLLTTPQPGAVGRPGLAHRGGRTRRDPRLDHRWRPQRTGCGSAPTRPPTRAPRSAARWATTRAGPARSSTGAPRTTSSPSTYSPSSGLRFTAARASQHAAVANDAERDLLDALQRLVADRLALIRTEFGRFTRQVSGYSLEHLLPENGFDVAKFLVGTEGTLATVLGATVRLVDEPQAVALAVLGYPDMPSAADAVPALLPHDTGGPRGHGRPTGRTSCARGAARPRCLTCRAARAGCSSRRPAPPTPRRRPRPRSSSPTPAASTPRSSRARRHARCGASARTAQASAVARPTTCRRGPVGRTRPSRPNNSAPTCASSTR